MSRSPFPPPRSIRPSPPVNGYGSGQDPSPQQIKPLQISRPSRPTTPSNSSSVISASPGGPSRPQRSERRAPSEYSISDASFSTTRQNGYSAEPTRYARSRSGSQSTTSRPIPSRPRAGTNGTDDSALSPELSPTALPTVLAAFQSAGQRKRTLDSYDLEYEKEKEREQELQKKHQQRIKERVPGRKTNRKARAGDVDAVLDEIKDEWEFVIDPDFNPVDLALQLLDESSTGKSMRSFRQTADMLSRALKGSVDKHYQAFNAALPHHASLLNHLDTAQAQLKEARTALQDSKEMLGSKRADLVQLWSRGQTVEEMIRILDQIEHLKTVPDILESLMSEKRLLQAAVLLVRSLKMINKPDMLEVGAVVDLRSYLNGQETSLREILVDELHAHLYLKSFWCDSRWAVYNAGQQHLQRVEFENEPLHNAYQLEASSPVTPITARTRLSRYLDDLTLRPNESPYDVSEPNFRNSVTGGGSRASVLQSALDTGDRNPETDSFAYVEMLLESLAVLGKLGSALDIVAQRVPSEIYALVEGTIDEVAERAEYGRRASVYGTTVPATGRLDGVYVFSAGLTIVPTGMGSVAGIGGGMMVDPLKSGFLNAQALRLSALESTAKQTEHETLKDLFWTLYSKLDAVMQGLRVIYEVSNRIGSRRDFKDSSGAKPGSLFPLAEIWAPVQAELRTLLNDYITDEEQGSVLSGRNPMASINEILREGRFNRDRSKPAFRFADTDIKLTNKVLREYEDELARVLRDSVPGLVQGSESAAAAALAIVGTDDRMLGSGQHHRLLVRPDAFHVSTLFQPTLAFLDRVAEVLPSGLEAARASSTVLDEFVLRVYLPQLEEKVSFLFHQALSGPEAFQPDPASLRLSATPLIKASTQLMALINSLCAMLRTTPFHRENYSRLILSVIIQFYQRCSDRFQTLASYQKPGDPDAVPRMALAAQWAQKADLNPCLSELLRSTDEKKRMQLYRQETYVEAQLLGDAVIAPEDLVISSRNLGELSSLYRSVAWFSGELNKLKAVPEESLSPTTPLGLNPLSATTPYTPRLPQLVPVTSDEQLQLPLGRDMALRFRALLQTYDLLAELILYSIRIDVRCRTMHHLGLALREGNYAPEGEVREPDLQIIELNAQLTDADEAVAAPLLPRERQFVFAGLGQLMEHLVIAGARRIRRANKWGMAKMGRNLLALQQSVKTVGAEDGSFEFERAKKYYALFNTLPTDMLDKIRQKPEYTFEEYQTMLNLQCGVDSTLGQAGAAQASDRNYSMYMIDLHGLELDTDAAN